jgi:hypothetical protein
MTDTKPDAQAELRKEFDEAFDRGLKAWQQYHGGLGDTLFAALLPFLNRRAPSPGQDEYQIVRRTLELAKAHWVKHGTPVKPEDAGLLLVDILASRPQTEKEGT